jgi:hypothetical protein
VNPHFSIRCSRRQSLRSGLGGASPCGAGTFGAIGPPSLASRKRAAQQLRLDTALTPAFLSAASPACKRQLLLDCGWLNTLNYTKTGAGTACTTGAAGNCGLPDLPSGVNAVTGSVMRNSGLFPENFFRQQSAVCLRQLLTNNGHSNYHSMQLEGTIGRSRE